jgi:hypothetical protein
VLEDEVREPHVPRIARDAPEAASEHGVVRQEQRGCDGKRDRGGSPGAAPGRRPV